MTNAASSPYPIKEEFSASASAVSSQHGKASPRITLRLTEEENTKLRDLCEGITVSAYVRQRLFGESTARRRRRSQVASQRLVYEVA
jgi:hypothetical protein